jgi:hypothetical protein
MDYRLLVYVHILGALIFFLGHGASAVMAFRLRREQNPDRLRALLDLSEAALPITWIGLLLLLVGGIGAGFQGNWWSKGWIGVSLVLILILGGWMGYYAQRYYGPLRKALGITYRGVPGSNPPATADEVTTLIKAANPMLLAGGGLGISAIILYLMIFKPF